MLLLYTDGTARRRGWSLIELLVVLAIISILGVISIPVLRSFARNDMRDGARTVYTMLRAARMYAMAYNVEAAVVYELDDEFLSGAPMIDTLRSKPDEPPVPARAIRAAQVMFRLPDEIGLRPPAQEDPAINDALVNWYSPQVGTFIPVPTTAGQRVVFPQGYALLLETPAKEYNPHAPPEQVYKADRDEINLLGYDPHTLSYLANYHRHMENPDGRYSEGTGKNAGLEKLGIMPIYAYIGGLADYSEGEVMEAQQYVHPRMAHIFAPRGNLISLQSAERYTMLFAPSPDTNLTERIWFVGTEPTPLELQAWLSGSQIEAGLIGIPIQIHRATGRVTMGSS